MAENNLCIALNQVGKTVDTPEGRLDILDDISLDVKYQEAVVVKGASGSGKTTLLGLMAGLDQASRGDVILFGHNLTHKNEEQRASIRAGEVGFVFQSFHLVQGATAMQNVMLPLELSGVSEAHSLAQESLQEVGLQSKRDTLVEHLSGGEQQRVAIARAYATQPRVLFADEPTGNLDRSPDSRFDVSPARSFGHHAGAGNPRSGTARTRRSSNTDRVRQAADKVGQ